MRHFLFLSVGAQLGNQIRRGRRLQSRDESKEANFRREILESAKKKKKKKSASGAFRRFRCLFLNVGSEVPLWPHWGVSDWLRLIPHRRQHVETAHGKYENGISSRAGNEQFVER